jgi:hypothetical protein
MASCQHCLGPSLLARLCLSHLQGLHRLPGEVGVVAAKVAVGSGLDEPVGQGGAARQQDGSTAQDMMPAVVLATRESCLALTSRSNQPTCMHGTQNISVLLWCGYINTWHNPTAAAACPGIPAEPSSRSCGNPGPSQLCKCRRAGGGSIHPTPCASPHAQPPPPLTCCRRA